MTGFKLALTLAVLALFSLSTPAQAQEVSVLEAPVIVAQAPAPVVTYQVSSLENPYYYAARPLFYRPFTRTVTVPVATTSVTTVGYSTASVRAAFFPRLKARRLALGYPIVARATGTQTVLFK